ncbi:MAG: bifunctional 3,4-dihydroxy-2-butanone-4-phosphate synthase/GTP cyclohydrolase II [Planctomycetes bacterium]|nr:bifunctional 3,4-dihydroxy-2-butanone-4-phosphate synthase/GTP cyclohydrolase II [Planctomycetota bacterium]MCC7398499.1 bifunctional 3,4-dihydroxy-2-butanone-4-phosphate synthase/GTP cyclohydrolase II [Planctomycetota bacterium]
MTIASIPELLEDLKAGRPVVLVDDPGRENEGDLCFAAEFATPELINLMSRHACGLICLALEASICDQLNLPQMVTDNTTRHGTAFTVSVGAATGVTTGISASDRAKTVLAAVSPAAKPGDLTRPGHIFPLRARDGGVLVRSGHTEAIVDLCRLAGLRPAGVICEIQREDGEMARLPELQVWAEKRGIKIGCIADLVEYRRRRERLIERVAVAQMPTAHGMFDCHTYRSTVDGRTHMALTVGIERVGEAGRFPPIADPVLVRVHSQCLTGDAFGSLRCDCGPQLQAALRQIQEEGRGVLLYISQEGRGIGLANKLRAYELQDGGMDTVEANVHLGFRADEREYGTGAQILHDLGVRQLRLLTNNPKKLVGLQGYGLEVAAQVPLVIGPNTHNQKYLETKRDKLGHLFAKPE